MLDADRHEALVPIGQVDAFGPCRYQELRHHTGELPRTVVKVWRSDVRETGSLDVVPDGCVELVCDAGGRVEVWGPSTGLRRVSLIEGASYVGVRLAAGAASAVLRMSADQLAGLVVDGSDTGLGAMRPGRAGWLETVLERADSAVDVWAADEVALVAPRLLGRAGTTVAEVAALVGVSDRQLHRRFTRVVGLSPSAYRRLVRTRHALGDLIGGAAPRIADVAHRHGFFDQAHFTREVIAVAGHAPATLRRRAAVSALGSSSSGGASGGGR